MANAWLVIQNLYKERYGIEPHLVDYVAVNDILKLCASGLSNKHICKSLDQSPIYVAQVLFHFLGFNGWDSDLDLSPWNVYNRVSGNKLAFEKEILDLTNLLNDDIIDLAYRVCSIYASIRKEMEKFYERS